MPGHLEYPIPLDLEPGDPDFPRECIALTQQSRSEITELIAVSRDKIAASRALMAEIDRVLASR